MVGSMVTPAIGWIVEWYSGATIVGGMVRFSNCLLDTYPLIILALVSKNCYML
jgi:hypothetical protein